MNPSIERIKGSDGTGNVSLATVTNSRAPAATTIQVDTVTNFNVLGFEGSMGTPHTFTDPVTSETITVISEATCVDFSGHIDGSNIEIDEIADGYTDLGSEVGDIVIIRPTTNWANNVADVLEVTLEDDGELKPDAAINSPQGTLANVTPVGSVLDYAGTAAPTGWLLCYGQALNAVTSTQYQDLFDVIGNVFGGSDNTDFVVPDLRGRVVAGQDDMGGSSANRLTNPASTTGGINGDTFGTTGGVETHVLTVAQLAAHTHTTTLPANATAGATGNFFAGNNGGSLAAPSSSTGTDAAHNNVQPTMILNKIIKY